MIVRTLTPMVTIQMDQPWMKITVVIRQVIRFCKSIIVRWPVIRFCKFVCSPGCVSQNHFLLLFSSCYTMDPNQRQEVCDVPPCHSTKFATEFLLNATICEGNCTTTECGTMRFAQKDYRGSINTTWSGRYV